MEKIVKKDKMLQRYCLLYSLLEKNCRLEKLIEFKRKAVPVAGVLVQILMTNFLNYSQAEATVIAEQMIALIIGLYPVSHVTQKQKEATILSNTGYKTPDFLSVCQKGIAALLV